MKRRTNGAWVQDIADQRSSFGTTYQKKKSFRTIIKQTKKKKKGKGCACGKLWGEGGERERERERDHGFWELIGTVEKKGGGGGCF